MSAGLQRKALTVYGSSATKTKAIAFLKREPIHRQAHSATSIEEKTASIHTKNAVIEVLQTDPKRVFPDPAEECRSAEFEGLGPFDHLPGGRRCQLRGILPIDGHGRFHPDMKPHTQARRSRPTEINMTVFAGQFDTGLVRLDVQDLTNRNPGGITAFTATKEHIAENSSGERLFNPLHRIDGHTIDPDFPMQMRPGHAPSRADCTNNLPDSDRVAM
jgi:hypothetical protein